MNSGHLASPCGLYCGPCEHLGEKCKGCGNQMGKPFWTDMMKIEICPLYDCCVHKRTLEHCGHCDQLPCDLFKNFYDPSLSPEEAKGSVLSRQHALARRREIGTEEWLEEIGEQ